MEIHWPEIDEDLSVEGLLAGVPARGAGYRPSREPPAREQRTSGRRRTNGIRGMTVKLAISLDEDLLERIDALASERRLPRSRVLALAADEFLHRRESRRLLERLDEAHAAREESSEESMLWDAHCRRHRTLMEREG